MTTRVSDNSSSADDAYAAAPTLAAAATAITAAARAALNYNSDARRSLLLETIKPLHRLDSTVRYVAARQFVGMRVEVDVHQRYERNADSTTTYRGEVLCICHVNTPSTDVLVLRAEDFTDRAPVGELAFSLSTIRNIRQLSKS
jgi:hypothetical protein